MKAQESFQGYAGAAFDPMAPVLAAADVTLDGLFDGARATRLVEFHARDAASPSLDEVIEQALKATWYTPMPMGLASASKMTVDGAVLDHLMAPSTSAAASPLAKAVVKGQLTKLRGYATEKAKDASVSVEARAFYTASLDQIGGRAGSGATAAGGGAAGPGAGRGRDSSTSIPAGAPIEPELTFQPYRQSRQ